ncbi:MAG: response regulator [Deltaproteobacteria bacterium]|nr:response regulator [Deltaproteobacteria bacterium]
MEQIDNEKGYFRRFQTFVINRMASPSAMEKDSLLYWRARILFAILFTSLLLGVLLFIPIIPFVIKESLWRLAIMDCAAWLILLGLVLCRLRYEIRAAISLLMTYVVGVAVILLVGPLSGGPAWLFAFAVLTGVLLGSKSAIVALSINAITLTIIGWLITTGRFGQTFPFFNTSEAMIVAGANFMFLNAVAAISVTVLVKGLISIHQKERVLNSTLETERSHLMEAKERLELEVGERKQAEQALRESEKRLNAILDATTETMVLFDRKGIVHAANQTVCDRLGTTKKELIGKRLYDFFPPALAESRRNKYNRVFNTGKSITFEDSREGMTFEQRAYPVLGDGDQVNMVAAYASDSTKAKQAEKEKMQLQAQLQRAQKMEAIGTLAGGVAHDLNNILGGLVSYPELLLLQLPEDSPLRKSILTIQKSGEKAAAVVQDLLTLARRGVVVTEVVNLNDVIADYLKSPEHENLQSYHPGVHIETHLDKDALNILGSSTHLSKTVMNLISNAAEAMPEGGKLTVSTKGRYIDKLIRGYDHIKDGDYVILTISDTGTGISPDDIEKIFEPFYTKKKMGRSGTGLGMAVVWGTVKDHNGHIDVQSTEGRGTTFTLYFPVTRENLPEDEASLPIESYSGNGESILIVDDVEEQRKIASGMLKELGYSVLSVSSGEEAVEYLRTNKVDLLVLDMIMDPGMDGLDTYKKILEMHPGQKAIIASGFSETDRVKEVESLGAGAYIGKPLLLEKIGIAVKEELEK